MAMSEMMWIEGRVSGTWKRARARLRRACLTTRVKGGPVQTSHHDKKQKYDIIKQKTLIFMLEFHTSHSTYHI